MNMYNFFNEMINNPIPMMIIVCGFAISFFLYWVVVSIRRINKAIILMVQHSETELRATKEKLNYHFVVIEGLSEKIDRFENE